MRAKRSNPSAPRAKPGARPDKFITLEIARFIAAFFVAAHHTYGYAAGFGPGWHGFDLPALAPVIFFFVLSGFVIQTAHADDYGRLNRIPRYVWRRICRVYPLYWLSLAPPVYLLWRLLTQHYLFQLFTLTPFVHNFIDINAVAWTLRFEIAFYLTFGLALLPIIGRPILAAWIILDIWRWFAQLMPFTTPRAQNLLPEILNRHFFNTQEMLFFAGLAAAFLLRRWQPPRAVLWPLLAAALLAILLVIRPDHWGFNYPPAPRVPLAAASFAAAIFCLAALERGNHLRPHPRLAILGALSYPLYLFHVVVMFLWSVACRYHPNLQHLFPPAAVFILILTASLLAAAAAVQFYDRPLQKRLRKLMP